ncbi:hypothetical protein CVT25_000647 [Psilocybe cyanescens]|uniref:Uncharacterized protein n=1 Tax=Psilocybe cyanescens TaxID=93625 RepID=A0A409X3N7_PSICY|nr:hypothetical protein CVT25_000647 [Psilocybe cyanescens]
MFSDIQHVDFKMRFSLLLATCALASTVLAVPVIKPGTNKKPKDESKPKTPAEPGDVVLVNSHDFVDGKINGHGSSERKTHPAIVVHHDENHIVHVAPIGHAHPGGVPTMPAADYNIPGTKAGPGLIGLGPPKQIHQDDVKPLGEPRHGNPEIPKKLTADQFNHLQEQIALHNPPAPEPPAKEKGKKKGKDKRSLERRHLEARLYDYYYDLD